MHSPLYSQPCWAELAHCPSVQLSCVHARLSSQSASLEHSASSIVSSESSDESSVSFIEALPVMFIDVLACISASSSWSSLISSELNLSKLISRSSSTSSS